MPGFTKLFATILTSTIWRESPEVCKVWITMLALADQDGVVEASVPGLADMARVSLSEVEAALAKFQSPDPYSRSPENEGRRIEPVKGGWRLVNYDHYRHRLDPDEQNQKHAIRQQRYRQRLKERDAALRTVTQGDGCVTPKDTGYDIAEAEAEAEPEADADAEADADEKRGYCAEPDGSTPASAVITLPLNDNSEYPIVQQQVSEWSALFRAVNVGQQLRNMKAWLLANPTRRKTNRGIERFIVGWLSREQNNPNFHRSMSDGPAIKESPRTQRNRASL